MHVKDHGKLRWFSKAGDGFFGEYQHERKYKIMPNNYRSKTEPAFWGSTTIFVAYTDAYHASQALMRILMSLSITLAIGAPCWSVIAIWWTYAGVHALFYKILSR
jgi:hypothetical protein